MPAPKALVAAKTPKALESLARGEESLFTCPLPPPRQMIVVAFDLSSIKTLTSHSSPRHIEKLRKFAFIGRL